MRPITFAINVWAAFHAGNAWAVNIIGGPTYDEFTGNGYYGSATTSGVLSGIAVGNAEKRENTASKGHRVVMWNSDSNFVEFESLWSEPNGDAESSFRAINSAKISVGITTKFDGHTDLGPRPIRWDANGNATELAILGVNSVGKSFAEPTQINSSGFASGIANKYVGEHDSNLVRAVRWNPDGSIVQLGLFGDIDTEDYHSRAFDMNESGVVVGTALKLDEVLGYGIPRAARWDVNGNITELVGPNPQIDYIDGVANAINNHGDAVGTVRPYTGPLSSILPMRWDGNTNEPLALEHLGVSTDGLTFCDVGDINDSKIAVGWAAKWDENDRGNRPVRWDANGNITELGNLGLSLDGYAEGIAFHVNNAGIAVGVMYSYDALGNGMPQAVYWGQDGVAVPISSLVDPSTGWVRFEEVHAISNDNWITGVGRYDPPGPAHEYPRGFMIQIPEPTIVCQILSMSLLALRRLRLQNAQKIRL